MLPKETSANLRVMTRRDMAISQISVGVKLLGTNRGELAPALPLHSNPPSYTFSYHEATADNVIDTAGCIAMLAELNGDARAAEGHTQEHCESAVAAKQGLCVDVVHSV